MTLLGELRDLWAGVGDYYRWLEESTTEWMLGEEAWMTEEIPQCQVGKDPHPASDKRGKATGHLLCSGHYETLDKTLRQVETEFGDLAGHADDPDSYAAAPSIAVQWNTGGGGHSGSGTLASHQSPALLDPIVLADHRQGMGYEEDEDDRHAAGETASVLFVLCRYATRVREERCLGYPAESRFLRWDGRNDDGDHCAEPCKHPACQHNGVWVTSPTRPTVHSERILLARHLEWVARWAADPDPAFDRDYGIREVYEALRRMLAQLREATGTAERSPVPGWCPHCEGHLWPDKPTETSQSKKWTGSAYSAVKCVACGARWEGADDMARLAIMVSKQRRKGTSA